MFGTLTPAVRALLYVNLSVFAVEWLTGRGPFFLWLLSHFALWPLGMGPRVPPFEPWQLVSYAFLHEGWMHLAGNMLGLVVFGPDSERVLGTRRFWSYYFVCVVGAALTQLFVMSRLHPGPEPTLGASGGIFGVMLLFALAYPHRTIMLIFPPIPMPAWLFVAGYGLIELYLGVFQTRQGVAHFAHLGGMVAGFVLLRVWGSTRAPPRRRAWPD